MTFCVAMKYVGLVQNGQLPRIGLLQGRNSFPSPTFNGIKPQVTGMPECTFINLR